MLVEMLCILEHYNYITHSIVRGGGLSIEHK